LNPSGANVPRDYRVAGIAAVAICAAVTLHCSRAPAEPAPIAAATATLAPARSGKITFVHPGEGDARAAIAAASDGNPDDALVYIGAPWCEPCKRFHAAALAGELDSQLGPLRLIEFNAEVDAERLASAGYAPTYVPFFSAFTKNGNPTTRNIEGSVKGPDAPRDLTRRLRILLNRE
jgi:thiol-disulfide isomerase/thioredoxin